jgi:hypothetical protein
MSREPTHLGNVPTDASFSAVGSFPSHQLWNVPIDVFGLSSGLLYRQTCQKADLQKTIPRAGTGRGLGPSLSVGQPRTGPTDPAPPPSIPAPTSAAANALIALAMLSLTDPPHPSQAAKPPTETTGDGCICA